MPHILPVVMPNLKTSVIAKIGAGRWKGLYSLLSILGLVLIVFGWRQYRELAPMIYEPREWGSHANMLLAWIALILFAVPRSKPGKILAAVKHPMVVGTIYWSVGHLLANGDLASVLLFGSLLAFAIISRVSEFRKGDPNPHFVGYRSDFVALGAGTFIYAVILFFGHVWLSGVKLF